MERKTLSVTFLLVLSCSLAFIPISTQQSASDYDPWNDINEDGKIDIYDVASTAVKFGTSGNPAKNVTIACYATVSETERIEIDVGGIQEKYIDTLGYRKISMVFDTNVILPLVVTVRWKISECFYLFEEFSVDGQILKVYDILGQALRIFIYNPNSIIEQIKVHYYMTA